MSLLPNLAASLCLIVASIGLFAGCATVRAGENDRPISAQLGDDGRFRNAPDPSTRPTEGSWKIWSRFLFETQEGATPRDAIPVRRLSRALLDALDPAANHIVRLGHSSHLLKLQGRYWLIDPVFSERASPVQCPALQMASRTAMTNAGFGVEPSVSLLAIFRPCASSKTSALV